jgi:hypothetical protein
VRQRAKKEAQPYAVLSEEVVRDLLLNEPFETVHTLWQDVAAVYGEATLGKLDRFYLLTVLLHREDADHPWLYARCREVEKSPDGHLDLWAREHYKSTIITFAGAIQEILNNPEITIGIFSHNAPTAKKFLQQIKTELETNEQLKALYPDILWANPKTQAPKWSLEGGITVKRKKNPKEQTVEAHGLVDSMPTGSHFGLMIYDDVVVPESVTTPEQILKTTNAWSLSDNLGARDARGLIRKWHIGTRYKFGDTYEAIMEMGVLKPRIYAATADGTVNGTPVYLTAEAWAEKKKTQLPSILAAQMLQNPAAGNEAMFKMEWLRFAEIRPRTLNVYILCDPAQSRKKGSDKTAIVVIGLDAANNKYLLDGYHHKMNLADRWTAIYQLRKHWMRQPGVQQVEVGYERYGLQSDIEHFEIEMKKPGAESFVIKEVAWPSEGPGAKFDRIQRLVPDFMQSKFFLAATVVRKETLASGEVVKHYDVESNAQKQCRARGEAFRILKPIKRKDHEGQLYDLKHDFLVQFRVYPFISHEDLLDAASRIYDMEALPPTIVDEKQLSPNVYSDGV